MKLYNSIGTVFEAKSVKRPKFTYHRGRTWDSQTKSIDGEKFNFFYDSTWGANFYFDYDGRTYAIPTIGTPDKEGLYDERELYTKAGLAKLKSEGSN